MDAIPVELLQLLCAHLITSTDRPKQDIRRSMAAFVASCKRVLHALRDLEKQVAAVLRAEGTTQDGLTAAVVKVLKHWKADCFESNVKMSMQYKRVFVVTDAGSAVPEVAVHVNEATALDLQLTHLPMDDDESYYIYTLQPLTLAKPNTVWYDSYRRDGKWPNDSNKDIYMAELPPFIATSWAAMPPYLRFMRRKFNFSGQDPERSPRFSDESPERSPRFPDDYNSAMVSDDVYSWRREDTWCVGHELPSCMEGLLAQDAIVVGLSGSGYWYEAQGSVRL